MLSILDFHTKFHPNRTKIGKVSVLGWVGGLWGRVVGGVRGVESKNHSGFELCCPFLTSTPSFNQIGPNFLKFSVLGWVREVAGGGRLGRLYQINNSEFELYCPYLISTPKAAKLVFGVG